nr:hypothetical protein [Tanacetum cinerariifolium]
MYNLDKERGIIANIDTDKDVTLKNVAAVDKDVEVLSIHDDDIELSELKEVVEVVTTAKLMTEVVTAASATITTTTTLIPADAITAAPSAARRRKGVNTNDAASRGKKSEFKGRKPEFEIHVSPSSSAQTKKHDDQTKREAKGKSLVESSTRYRNLSVEFEDFSDNSINENCETPSEFL